VVLLVIAVTIAALPFIKIEISARARGIVRSNVENAYLQPAVYAEVKKIDIRENQLVAKGDTLVVLNTDKIDEQITGLKRSLTENLQFIADLQTLIDGKGQLQTPKYQSEKAKYTYEVEEQSIQFSLIKKQYELNKALYDKQVIARMDFLQYQSKYDAAFNQLNLVKKQYLNNWQSAISQFNISNTEIESNIAQLEKEKRFYVVIAPVSGEITNITGIKPGSFLVPNQTIAQISPNDDIMIECYIAPGDIGYIKVGQNVKLQMDAFNYNQWGFGAGEVIEVSPDIYDINNQPVFKIRCALKTDYLKLKNGHKGFIKKGMTLSARFFLTERSLWQLLFDKTDAWINPNLIQTNNNQN
jgi:HlyD family secretion protein